MKTMADAFIPLFERDLNALIKNLNAYEHEGDIWIIDEDIKNSAGNLALHLIGNLRHFVGHIIGGTTYHRQRDLEFGSKHIDREEIIKEIEITIEEVKAAMHHVTEEAFFSTFPINVFGHEMTTGYFITHLFGHLNYHLGQINYHQRLLGHKPVGWEKDA